MSKKAFVFEFREIFGFSMPGVLNWGYLLWVQQTNKFLVSPTNTTVLVTTTRGSRSIWEIQFKNLLLKLSFSSDVWHLQI